MNNDLVNRIEKNKDISSFLTLKNQVIVENFFEAKTRDDLIDIKRYSLKKNIPIFILGGGSNIAFLTDKFKGIVVKNNYRELKIESENSKEILISVSSGYPVSLLISKSIEKGWSGFEYHQGLPGTVGGAIYMNSKWTKPLTFFGDNLVFAYLIANSDQIKKVDKDYFKFAYDFSILQKTKEILLEAVFKLKKDDKKNIKERADFALNYRKKTQPFGVATSGCFFQNISEKDKIEKNLPTTSAGYLIDKAGLKGFSIGDFYVSNIHANFIINRGNGKREDLMKLLSIIKEKVKKKFGIELKEEVIII
ncbi:MAG: UDP-N-acetylmuramate dehydrogenase [Candidatus Microgenomates bacterium]